MKILHICAGWQKWNGAANIARMIMDEQRREGHEVSSATWAKVRELRAADEVWIHCGWLPCLWWAALVCFLTRIPRAKRVAEGDALAGVRRRGAECTERVLKWMPEACYDPVRLRYHGWKKWLAGPIERWCLRRCAKIVATCEAEKSWIESYLGRRCPPIALTDIKRFFKLHGEVSTQSRRVAEYAEDDGKLPSADGGLGQRPRDNSASSRLSALASLGLTASPGVASTRKGRLRVNNKNQDEPLHLLYLGRRHPLKGVEYLETAVRQIEKNSAYSAPLRLCVKIVSSAFGAELEKVWDWCDVLVLPTLSENFGLVIAEALERGKCVITTDGAPAWGEGLSRVEGLTQRRRDAECAEMFSRVERVEGGLWSGYEGRLIYLKGYRDGTDEERVELLKKAIDMLKHDGNMV